MVNIMLPTPLAATAEVPLSKALNSQLHKWSTSVPKRQYTGSRLSITLPLPASTPPARHCYKQKHTLRQLHKSGYQKVI